MTIDELARHEAMLWAATRELVGCFTVPVSVDRTAWLGGTDPEIAGVALVKRDGAQIEEVARVWVERGENVRAEVVDLR